MILLPLISFTIDRSPDPVSHYSAAVPWLMAWCHVSKWVNP